MHHVYDALNGRQTIPTDVIPTNTIPTKIHVDRHVVTLYIHIHQGEELRRQLLV